MAKTGRPKSKSTAAGEPGREFCCAAMTLARLTSEIDALADQPGWFAQQFLHRYAAWFTRWLSETIGAPPELWRAVNASNPTTVSFGGETGRSYAEIAVRLAQPRYELLLKIEGRRPVFPIQFTFVPPGGTVCKLRPDKVAEQWGEGDELRGTSGAAVFRAAIAGLQMFDGDALAIAIEKEFERAGLGRHVAEKRSDRKSDTESDKSRPFGTAEKEFAKLFITKYQAWLDRQGPRPTKDTVLSELLKKLGGSKKTISRNLSAHPEHWNPKGYPYRLRKKIGQRKRAATA